MPTFTINADAGTWPMGVTPASSNGMCITGTADRVASKLVYGFTNLQAIAGLALGDVINIDMKVPPWARRVLAFKARNDSQGDTFALYTGPTQASAGTPVMRPDAVGASWTNTASVSVGLYGIPTGPWLRVNTVIAGVLPTSLAVYIHFVDF